MTDLLAAILLATASSSIADMTWDRRVLIVAASTADDPKIIAQRRSLTAWRADAEQRDVTIVEVIGNRVSGAADTAAAVRATYRLPADRFAAILLGKDGDVKRRSGEPLTGAELTRTIDSMPMRRAGGR